MRRRDERIVHHEIIYCTERSFTVAVRAHSTGPAGRAMCEPPFAAEPAARPGREGQGGRGRGAGSPGSIFSNIAAAMVFLLVLYLLN